MNKIKAHLQNIALSHSIFALPFAFMGAFLAAKGMPTLHDLFWITVAMVGARSAALALNNLIDLKYDKIHPRFTKRPMVTGDVKPREVIVLIAVTLIIFFYAASQLHPICMKLAPLAIVPFCVYPYMKRFSWTCHLVLGLSLAVAPIGAWMAIRGDLTLPILLLGLAQGVWIAGFDVVYAAQDVKFDKEHGLHSMPERFGVAGALRLTKIMHVICIISFVLVGVLLELGGMYYLGVLMAATVLIYQNSIVKPNDLSEVTQKYFMRNGLVGICLALFAIVSLYQ